MDTVMVTAVKGTVAEKYERVHFVAHCRFGYVDEKELEKQVRHEVVPKVERETGYRCYYRGFKVKGLEPIWLDIDFVFDLPAGSPVAPAILALVILAIAATGVVIALVLIFWTVWHEESEIFVCEQCPDMPTFKGRADYDAHLKMVHPEKWSYIEEQREDAYWWMKWFKPEMILPILLLVLAIAVVPKLIPERRRE